jgi:hypothetical protein
MTQRPTALLLTARTAAEAQVVLALLRREGIEAYMGGQALTDEFAASQRLLGLQGTEIAVRDEDLLRAQAVLAEAKRKAQASGSDDAGEASTPTAGPPQARGPTGRAGAWIVAGVAVAAAVVLLFMWLEMKRELGLMRASSAGRKTRTTIEENGTRTVWKDTNRLASTTLDADHDGVPEQVTYYDRAGAKYLVATDVDRSGWPERREQFRDGRLTAELVDEDENGCSERMTTWWPDGSSCVWTDFDQDGAWDRRELYDGSGLLKLAQKDHELQGFVDVR